MSAVRDRALGHVERAGVTVNELHQALMVSASPASVTRARDLASRLASEAADLADALTATEVVA